MTTCPIPLIPGDDRAMHTPIGRPVIYAEYTKLRDSWWLPETIQLDTDRRDYDALSKVEQRPIYYINAFFASADNFVAKNLLQRFIKDIPIYEVELFYNLQTVNENIHAEVYAKIINAYVIDPEERRLILNAIAEIPIIQRLAQYFRGIIDGNASFAERNIRMIAVEGILFTMCFAIIFWYAKRGIMKGLCQANQLIARDEAIHTRAAIEIYRMVQNKLPAKRVAELFDEALEIGYDYIEVMLEHPLFDTVAGPLNKEMLKKYAQHQTNIIMSLMNLPTIYPGAFNPFPFMEMQSMPNHGNYFEVKGTEYRSTDPDSDSDDGEKIDPLDVANTDEYTYRYLN